MFVAEERARQAKLIQEKQVNLPFLIDPLTF